MKGEAQVTGEKSKDKVPTSVAKRPTKVSAGRSYPGMFLAVRCS